MPVQIKLKEIKAPDIKTKSSDIRAYVSNTGFQVLYSLDHTPKHGKLKHFSISRKDRTPTWEEILTVKVILMGDVDCIMVMPKYADYVNIRKYCFHVWECPEAWGIK